MPHPSRAPRYNAKARGSVAGGKKSRVKGKAPDRGGDVDGFSTAMEVDPNAEIVQPKTKEQKEQDRKERIREEVPNSQVLPLYGD